MDALDQQIAQYSQALEDLILPGTLIDCYEQHRRRLMRQASACFNDNELSWFLDMLNQLRGVADRQDDFDLLFDPMMYTENSPAWDAPPGLAIDLPVLNSQLAAFPFVTDDFRTIAEDEIGHFRTLADTYADEAMCGLALLAAAALVDCDPGITDRRSAIRYLALNASAKLEDYWAEDDTFWKTAGPRVVKLPNLFLEQKESLRRGSLEAIHGPLTEVDLTCYTDEEVKRYAFNPDKFLMSGKTKHMPVCGYCQERVAKWVNYARNAEERMMVQFGGKLPVA